MAVVMRFTPRGMTAAKYDEVVARLEAAGAGSPAGRLFHVCFGDKENLLVSDIWDSTHSFEAFAPTLGPILDELGIDKGEPQVIDVHNSIVGAFTSAAKP